MTTRPALRIEAFDLLRGLCALGVAGYHMLLWLKVVELHTWGLYGVYVFFLLSGASMTVAYADKLGSQTALIQYLGLRYARLAPLYALVCLWGAGLGLAFGSAPPNLWSLLFLNVTFLFGLTGPGATSMVTGGWSLGIEFLFYLVFPLLITLVQSRARWLVVTLAVLVQVVSVNLTVNGSLESSWASYIQFGSFVGYFAVGVLIGVIRLQHRGVAQPAILWLAWALCLGLLAVGSGSSAAETLVGVRGVALTFVAFALVAVSSVASVPGWLRPVAALSGEASYALYLVHPIVFSILSNRRLLKGLSESAPQAFVVVSLLTSVVGALISYRLIERPLLLRARRALTA